MQIEANLLFLPEVSRAIIKKAGVSVGKEELFLTDGQSLLGTQGGVFSKHSDRLSIWASSAILEHTPTWLSILSHRCLYVHVYCYLIHKFQEMELAWLASNWWSD